MDKTQSRTIAKAGKAATTAPKPTRLATLSAGKTDAFAAASMPSRRAKRRDRLTITNVTIAAKSATTTDHTPPIAERDVEPHRGSARNVASSRGRTNIDIKKLTPTTT